MGTVDGAIYRRMMVELRPRSRTAWQDGTALVDADLRRFNSKQAGKSAAQEAPSYMYKGGALVSQRRRLKLLRSRARPRVACCELKNATIPARLSDRPSSLETARGSA
jgi:hypothetical protein